MMRAFTIILLISLLIGCRTPPVPRENEVILDPYVRQIAEQAIKEKYPILDVAEFSHHVEKVDDHVIVEYKRDFMLLATPEEPFTRTMLDIITIQVLGTNVISVLRSQTEINRIPSSRDNI